MTVGGSLKTSGGGVGSITATSSASVTRSPVGSDGLVLLGSDVGSP